jgi:hypothetical protein
MKPGYAKTRMRNTRYVSISSIFIHIPVRIVNWQANLAAGFLERGVSMLLGKKWLRFAALLFGFLSGRALLGAPQQELVNQSFPEVRIYNFGWDSVHKVLIFFRNAAPTDTKQPPTIVAYHDGGAPTHISPLNDFPGATDVTFWGISGAPNGAVSVSSTVEYRTDNVRPLILTYDQKGKLMKVWDVFPYHFHEVAVDLHGNVYGFGHRLDKNDEASDGDYAMLVAYSPEGKILWEALPRSSFPGGEAGMMMYGNQSTNHLMLTPGGPLLYVASREELFHFDSAGKLLGRFPLNGMLASIARSPAFNAHILSMVSTASGTLIAQVQLWPASQVQLWPASRAANTKVSTSLVEIQSDFVNWRPLTPYAAGVNLGRLAGMGDEGKLLFFAQDAKGNSVLTSSYIP